MAGYVKRFRFWWASGGLSVNSGLALMWLVIPGLFLGWIDGWGRLPWALVIAGSLTALAFQQSRPCVEPIAGNQHGRPAATRNSPLKVGRTQMSGEANTAVEAAHAGGDDDEYLHIVSYWEWLIADVLRLRIPRSLCGVVLIEDPDRRPTQSADPLCPRCVEISDR